MDLRYHLQTTGLARVPVRLMALPAVGLVAIAPAALTQGNDGWSNASNGYGRYHESNGSAQAGKLGFRGDYGSNSRGRRGVL